MLYFLFFCSGLSGLIYQVVWVRVFANVFGNTIYSASLVIAVFMLGLGIVLYFGLITVGAGVAAVFGLIPATVGVANLAYAAVLFNKERKAEIEKARNRSPQS